jgi:DNA-binding transcriptional MerR regulator
MNVEIPDKLYFKIGEVGKLADVPPHVLRYWESEFSAIRPKRANSKQRLYRRADVELILKLKVLLHERRYTIAGAKKFLEEGGEWHEDLHEQPHEQPLEQKKVSLTIGRIKEELQDLQKLLTGKGVV